MQLTNGSTGKRTVAPKTGIRSYKPLVRVRHLVLSPDMCPERSPRLEACNALATLVPLPTLKFQR
eukprot:4803240-Lingulodinium_polyedra.AAC.1